ncbi:unnamed protein product [Brassica napus]|uniref:(rape) hypothetical protein n=1 Tax=Brassica napus TaxID=3708 RepID=A0A816Q490_BRANA|nr:unnamed protein product [Brassica napus]
MANSKVLLSDLMYCRCFSTAEVRVRPGMSSDIKSFVKKIASEMEGGRERRSKRQRATGEQLIFLKKSGKGKRPGKGGNCFWKNIGLGFKTPPNPLTDITLTRNVRSLELFL